jgi:hypothetical protein
MATDDAPPASKGTVMAHLKAFALAALVAAAVGAPHAQAGMSGTSSRVEQQAAAEAQAAVQTAPSAARPAAQPPVQSIPVPAAARPNVSAFDGVWAVATSPGCGLLARSAVQVRRGRITGEYLRGSIDATGNVSTIARGGGISVISKGHSSATAGSGTYRVSTGCTGTWTSRKV